MGFTETLERRMHTGLLWKITFQESPKVLRMSINKCWIWIACHLWTVVILCMPFLGHSALGGKQNFSICWYLSEAKGHPADPEEYSCIMLHSAPEEELQDFPMFSPDVCWARVFIHTPGWSRSINPPVVAPQLGLVVSTASLQTQQLRRRIGWRWWRLRSCSAPNSSCSSGKESVKERVSQRNS